VALRHFVVFCFGWVNAEPEETQLVKMPGPDRWQCSLVALPDYA
jgi:hypothetical protein